MKCVILLNGENVDNYKTDKNDYIIAADGALNFALKNNINVNKSVGDFDSLGYVPLNAELYSTDKDYTDGEIALKYAKSLSADTVDFVCAGGFRDDHFLCNLALLEQAKNMNIFARAITKYSTIYLVSNKIELNVNLNTTISVIAVENSIIESSFGLKYSYNNTELKRCSTLGISNIAVNSNISIKLKKGLVYLIVNNN